MAETKNSVVNVDLGKGVSKVGISLIEKVAEGIGGMFRPRQIVRIAEAEAKARVIAAKADFEVRDIGERAELRRLAEEARKQANIESITERAIPLLDESSDPSRVEDDWVANFFEKSRIVSDADMQELWSKVLAGEANAPGRFSKRTVNLIADLDRSDAELFSTLCSFSAELGDVALLIFDPDAEIYNRNGINFKSLLHLEALGLITFDSFAGYSKTGLPEQFKFNCRGTWIGVDRKGYLKMSVGKVLLTTAGFQLAGLSMGPAIDGWPAYVVSELNKAHVTAEITDE